VKNVHALQRLFLEVWWKNCIFLKLIHLRTFKKVSENIKMKTETHVTYPNFEVLLELTIVIYRLIVHFFIRNLIKINVYLEGQIKEN